MKIHLLTLSSILALAAVANADHGIVETTGEFNSSGSNVYLTQTNGHSNANDTWQGKDLGTFDTSNGDTLNFTNFYFENYAFNGPNGNNWLDAAMTATLRILVNSSTVATYGLTQTSVDSNNRFWSIDGGTSLNILSGLSSNTNNTVGFEIDYTYNQFDGSTTVLTAVNADLGTADFTVVPEPGTYALIAGIIGFAFVALRRRNS